ATRARVEPPPPTREVPSQRKRRGGEGLQHVATVTSGTRRVPLFCKLAALMADIDNEALEYHSVGRPGKIEVVPTKPTATQRDLALAYTPGVAKPCLEIAKNPEDVYKYTAKGNLVAVITNGTAVLGLGAIGAAAGKP